MDKQQTIAETEQEIVEDFKLLESWDEDAKYEYIIDMGKNLPELEEQYKVKRIRLKVASLPSGWRRTIRTGLFILMQTAIL